MTSLPNEWWRDNIYMDHVNNSTSQSMAWNTDKILEIGRRTSELTWSGVEE